MRPVMIRGRGHPNVRATHPKTIELTADADLGVRGTCIVAVAADLDPARLVDVTGRVVVTVEVGGHRDRVRGNANPRYDASTGRLVIRRSHHRAADTLVVGADKGSADLDRGLVAALADGRAEVHVRVEPDEQDGTHAVDDTAVLLDADVGAAQTVAARIIAVFGDGAAVAFAGVLPRRATDRRRALRGDEPALTVWQVRPEDLAAVVDAVEPRRVAGVVTDPATADEHVWHTVADARAIGARARAAFVVLRATNDATNVDERIVAALVEAGVPAKTVQAALVAATGMSKREAYARVVRART